MYQKRSIADAFVARIAGLLAEPVDWAAIVDRRLRVRGDQSRDGRSVYPASSLAAAVPATDYLPDASVTGPLMPS